MKTKYTVEWVSPFSMGAKGALSDEVIERLSFNFQLDPGLLTNLSRSLVVWPRAAVRGFIEPMVKAKKGAQKIEKSITDLRLAQKKIRDATGAISEIRVWRSETLSGAEERWHESLVNILDEITKIRVEIEAHAKGGSSVSLKGLPDKRQTHDDRRRSVCFAVFRTWERASRDVTLTTTSSGRSGPLMDFVNAVVAAVSAPPGTLSGEAIRRERDAFRRQKQFEQELELLRANQVSASQKKPRS